MNAEDFIKLAEYIKENYVPKDNSNDECFEDYLYAVLKDIQINFKYLCIALELLAVLIVGMIPATVDPLLSLYPIFFVTAFQWCVFKGAEGYACSTIFSTNNLKQTVLSFTEYFMVREDDEEERTKKLKMRLSRKSSSMSRLLLTLKLASLQSFSQGSELLIHSHLLMILIRDIVPAIVRTVLPIMAIAMDDGTMVMVMCMAVSSAVTKATEASNGVIHIGL